MLRKLLPVFLATLLCFMLAPPVATLQASNVNNKDESIEVDADGIVKNMEIDPHAVNRNTFNVSQTEASIEISADGATKNANEGFAKHDLATNGGFDEHAAVANKKNIKKWQLTDGSSTSDIDREEHVKRLQFLIKTGEDDIDDLPGLKGKDGAPGLDGKDGIDGKDGTSFKNLSSKTKAALAAPKAFMRSESAFVEAEPEEKHRDFGGGRRTDAANTATTPKPKTIDFEFGGTEHSKWWVGSVGEPYQQFIVTSPEAVKSKACKGDRCWDCSQPSQCFHGETERTRGGFALNALVVNAAAGSDITHYEAEVWARCPLANKEAEVSVYISEKSNGRTEIYIGNERALNSKGKDASSVGFNPNKDYVNDKGRKFTFAQEFRNKERIRVLFFPEDPAKESHVAVKINIYGAKSSVERCMAVKDCLGMLGTRSDVAFKLRNGNRLQLLCLTMKFSELFDSADDIHSSISLVETCRKWRKCVKKSGKKKELIAILRAGLKKTKEVLLEDVSLSNETCFDANADTCVEPGTADPESWDCECAEGMIKACADAKGHKLALCIQGLMCENRNVCCSWKQDHCSSPIPSTGSVMAERSQVSTKVVTSSSLHNDLDGTVQGKACV